MTFYLCDKKDHCCNSDLCSINGGDCKHTVHADHAINGECLIPAKEPERFEADYFDIEDNETKTISHVTYYWEIDHDEKEQEN